jgi:dimeric dUTPase (all-alpha-NTP-PPase superfamily)
MNKYELKAKIIRTEDLLNVITTQWGICEPDVLRKVILKLEIELEELYAEQRRRQARELRIKRKATRTRKVSNT